MPIKEYYCSGCDEQFERFHKTQFEAEKARDSTFCPRCGNRAVVAVSKPSEPQFKGSGFYKTDYKGR